MSLEKKAVGIALLWWLFSGSKKKSAGSSSASSSTPKSSAPKVTPSEPGRPEEAKPKAGPPVDLRPDDDDDAEELPKPKGEKPKGEKPKGDQGEAKPKGEKPKGEKPRGISKEQQADAAEFARGFFKVYTDRGIEDPQAAADCLSIYMLAGGNDPKEIALWQKKIGVTPSGEYDKETSTAVATMVDMAVDGAINGILQRLFSGENPPNVAGEILQQYVREGREIGTVIPREKIAALQMFLGVQPVTGRLDEATKNRLVELGITPTEEE